MESMEPKFEKKSSIQRIVGGSDEEKEKVKSFLEERFTDQNIDETEEIEGLQKKELEKTTEEVEMIDLVNKETNKLLAKYDLPESVIPRQNVHIFSQKNYEELRGRTEKSTGKAHFASYSQAVFMRRINSNIIFTKEAFHEFLHFKSYQAFQKQMTEEGRFNLYRLGLAFYSRDGKREYFRNLNEALTEELVKRFYFNNSEELKNNPLFKKEVEEIENIRKVFLDNAKTKEDEKRAMDIIEITPVRKKGFKKIREIYTFTNSEGRDMLNNLLDKLYQKNQDKFKDQEEVFDVFAKSMLDGNLLPVGKLVDRTLGKGSFRKIGELDNNIEEQNKFIESL